MATRTGAAYLHLEGTLCPEDEGGCGQFLRADDHDEWPLAEGVAPVCPNCGHAPLAHVSVTTADQIAGSS